MTDVVRLGQCEIISIFADPGLTEKLVMYQVGDRLMDIVHDRKLTRVTLDFIEHKEACGDDQYKYYFYMKVRPVIDYPFTVSFLPPESLSEKELLKILVGRLWSKLKRRVDEICNIRK